MTFSTDCKKSYTMSVWVVVSIRKTNLLRSNLPSCADSEHASFGSNTAKFGTGGVGT